VPGAVYAGYCWDYGDSLFQDTEKGPGIRFTHIVFKEPDRLRLLDREPLLTLQFILSNSWYEDTEGLGKRVDHEGSCNMVYRPSTDMIMEGLNRRTYSKVELLFSPETLKPLAPHFPLLRRLINKADQGLPSVLDSVSRLTTRNMFGSLHDMLNNRYHGDLRKMYNEAKGMEILLELLDIFSRPPLTPPSNLSPAEAERIYQARDLMLENHNSPTPSPSSFSLAELAYKTGTNTFKLNTGFKEIYGLSVFHFFLNMRMVRAQALLQNTKEPMGHIAHLTGYADADSFSKAFKKHFGASPRAFRSGHTHGKSHNGARH